MRTLASEISKEDFEKIKKWIEQNTIKSGDKCILTTKGE